MTQVDWRHSNSFKISTLYELGKEVTEEPDNGLRKPMHFEENRILSYQDWPLEYLSKEELARKGFYYTKKDDIVRCAFCNIELGDWKVGDDVSEDHRKWSRNCPFVRGAGCGNVPMEPTPTTDKAKAPTEGQDTCGKYGIQVHPNTFPENEEPSSDISTNTANIAMGPLKSGFQSKSATYKDYVRIDARLKSFQEWPISKKQKSAQLAEAGFYYTGKSDQTICFFCGVGLNKWEEEDVPWEQHARWSRKCGYLRIHKSAEYIDEVFKKFDVVLSSDQAEELVPNLPGTSTNATTTTTTTTSISTSTSTGALSDESTNTNKTHDSTKENSDKPEALMLCKICFMNDANMVSLPCGHLVACTSCAPALTKCAVCRGELDRQVRVFFT